jgi:hypothetical protein
MMGLDFRPTKGGETNYTAVSRIYGIDLVENIIEAELQVSAEGLGWRIAVTARSEGVN